MRYWRNAERRRERAREYARAHKAEAKVRMAEWLADPANIERKREGDRAWRERNAERKRANDKRWREANKERQKANHLRWRQQNPERWAELCWLNKQRRAKAEPMDKDAQAYVRIIRGDCCAYCGGEMGEIDHIEPLRRSTLAGWNDWSNLTASCAKCNRRKSDRPLLTFLLDQPLT